MYKLQNQQAQKRKVDRIFFSSNYISLLVKRVNECLYVCFTFVVCLIGVCLSVLITLHKICSGLTALVSTDGKYN